MTIINDAARIIRAGEEYSQTNYKLRQAVWEFVEWLVCTVGSKEFPEGLGWSAYKDNDGHYRCSWRGGGWESGEIITGWRDQKMSDIHRFCQLITGDTGRQLVEWLEKTTRERKELLNTLESTQTDFQRAVPDTPTFTSKEFADLGFPYSDAEVTFMELHPAYKSRIPQHLMDAHTSNHTKEFRHRGQSNPTYKDPAYDFLRPTPAQSFAHIFIKDGGCKHCKHHLRALLEESKRLLFEVTT